jgi:hypothetical protein
MVLMHCWSVAVALATSVFMTTWLVMRRSSLMAGHLLAGEANVCRLLEMLSGDWRTKIGCQQFARVNDARDPPARGAEHESAVWKKFQGGIPQSTKSEYGVPLPESRAKMKR